MFFIFYLIRIANFTSSFFSRYFRFFPSLSFTMKLMGVGYYLCNIYFLLKDNNYRGIILIFKVRVDSLFVVNQHFLSLNLIVAPWIFFRVSYGNIVNGVYIVDILDGIPFYYPPISKHRSRISNPPSLLSHLTFTNV
jgi:hypothetical protein